MQLRWTEEAEADLRRIADFLFEEAPGHAPRIVQAIYDASASLLTLPARGRPGKKTGHPRAGTDFFAVSSRLHRDRRHHLYRPYSAWRAEVAVTGFQALTCIDAKALRAAATV